MTSTAIVGAGAAGLSLALMLEGEVQVFEKESKPGGLCRSTQMDGFTWDKGPHILGGIPEAVEWVKDSTSLEWEMGTTRNVAYIDGEFAPHPMENPADVERYMQKMWKAENLDALGLGAQKGRKPGGVSWWQYPLRGGYQAITDDWAAQLGPNLRLGDEVETADDLIEADYDRVVWTAPIGWLPYNTLTTVTALCEGPHPPYTAIYLPDISPFHRLSFPGAFGIDNTPDGGVSIQGEVSNSNLTDEALRDAMVFTCEWLGLLAYDQIRSMHVGVVPYAYPVPMACPRPPMFESLNIYLHGRTGAHRYLNIDGVVAESLALAKILNSSSSRKGKTQ